MSARDADRLFHETWLGLAQPIEGLVFSVPVLAEAQIAPAPRPEITAQLCALLVELPSGALSVRSARALFESFLGYDQPGMLIGRDTLPTFRAPESRQEVRASFAVARRPDRAANATNDPFAEFGQPEEAPTPDDARNPLMALVWDLADDAPDAPALDLDAPEEVTGPWRYPPTAKLERLLRHTGIPVGFLSNGRHLRVVYAPRGETTSHLTFRMDDLADPAGRPLALALELLFHARRTYGADTRFTFEGLLADSRSRQADVTGKLAEQVRDAVDTLLAGFEAAAARDCIGNRPDWLRAAMEAGHVYPGTLNSILRLVFLLYAEDRSLMPVDQPLYAEHLSVFGLYERLVADAGAHPESMHHRFGAYGALVALFRAVYFGVRHGTLHLPPRQGKLFDPSAYPFLEGGLPDWTAAVSRAEDRAQVQLPSVADRTIHDALHCLIVLDGQRLSYRDLSVEQIGAVYESLMGYEVLRLDGPAVRLGKDGVWVTIEELRGAGNAEQKKLLEDRCELSAPAIKNVLAALAEHADDGDAADAIAGLAGKKSLLKNRGRLGRLVLQPTPSRRSTGSFYTPRSLSERVVRRTLEPILACLGEAPAAERILELKVCDPAMGSGAFLVEACRFLAEQVRNAWERSGELPGLIEKHGEPLMHAKRLVAERCLYGVDKNAAAVELAKLSLWLETMSADKSFTFLDHVLRHGDSLVGLDLDQIRSFHWQPEKQLPTVAHLVDNTLAEVREHREAIQALADDESDSAQNEKRRLLELAELAMDRIRLVADACVGAFFAAERPKERDAERATRLTTVEAWLGGDESRRGEVEEWSREMREKHPPFHWYLELPEVFFLERPDPLEQRAINRAAFVDAFLGNPPFLGAKYFEDSFGAEYRDWLYDGYQGVSGRADLAAWFFRRAAALIGRNGCLGFLATNTIAQGDTRESGLERIIAEGGTIFAADLDMPWPGNASVTICPVHVAWGNATPRVATLGDVQVSGIGPDLKEARGRREGPAKLVINDGCNFNGINLGGQGFLLSRTERDAVAAGDPRILERTPRYIGGDDLNSSAQQDSALHAINIGDLDLEAAERSFGSLLTIVRERVKPGRDAARQNTHGQRLRTYWWRFRERQPALQAGLRELDRCIVAAIYTKHLSFSFQGTGQLFNNKVSVFLLDRYTAFAVLQSRCHESWARLHSPTMGVANTLAYAPSECFRTFPFPLPDPRAVIPAVEAVGERLYAARAAYMVDTNQGLTQTYNQLKDPKCDEPRILSLRALHEEMDRAVLDAYGWSDLAVPPFCSLTPDDQRALESFLDAVIDRLFVLNAQRAEEEKRLGAAKPTKATKGKKTPAGPKATAAIKKTPAGQGVLFGSNDDQ